LEEWSVLGKRICPHLHLPLQSGDEAILKDMGRGYGPQDFIETAQTLYSIWPQATLTTEVIVGYPGESEEAFRSTVRVLEAVKPSRLHVFRFSPRPGTKAGGGGNLIPVEVAGERSRILRGLGEGWRREYIRGRLGETCRLLVENIIDDGEKKTAKGTSEDYIKAVMACPPREAQPGRLIPGRLCSMQAGLACLEPVEETVG
jgi:threonylcarbamoyladenosine tRNA methylthiotransferase MtaB